MKHCHNRFDDGAYLQTCQKEVGHPDKHQGENDSSWDDEHGWWDIYGDQPEKATLCACGRCLVGRATLCVYCEEEQYKASTAGSDIVE